MPPRRNDLTFYDRMADHWWDESAKIYALHHLNPLRFNYFDRFISSWKDLRVLDAGCGGGYTCEFLAQRGAIVSAIDQSLACIQRAIEQAQPHYKIDYLHGYADSLPYANQSFDAVLCVDVQIHSSARAISAVAASRI